jgi:microcystin-dependent protein
MADPYIGEIRMFAGNFAPAGWAFCSGQLLPISENEPLFQLIGTTYGGDGQETFALPNLQSRVPMHQGNGFILAEEGGVEDVTLTVQQIPNHTHAVMADSQPAEGPSPSSGVFAETDSDTYAPSGSPVALAAQTVTPSGGFQPHNNMQPYLVIHFIISLYGIFPQPA